MAVITAQCMANARVHYRLEGSEDVHVASVSFDPPLEVAKRKITTDRADNDTKVTDNTPSSTSPGELMKTTTISAVLGKKIKITSVECDIGFDATWLPTEGVRTTANWSYQVQGSSESSKFLVGTHTETSGGSSSDCTDNTLNNKSTTNGTANALTGRNQSMTVRFYQLADDFIT